MARHTRVPLIAGVGSDRELIGTTRPLRAPRSDPVWDLDGKPAEHLSDYEPLVSKIAERTSALAKPVLMFNGDSHVHRSDNPLSSSDPLNALHPGHDVPNFHRVVVHGSTYPLEWLRLTVHPRASAPAGPNAFGPFSWEQVVE